MALFHDVPDAAGLRARLISASTMQGAEGNAERAKVDFAFLDARSVRLPTPSPELACESQWSETPFRTDFVRLLAETKS